MVQTNLRSIVRPEYITLAAERAPGAVPAKLLQVQDIGTYWLLTTQVAPGPGAEPGAAPTTVRLRLESDQEAPAVGAELWLKVLGAHSCLYANDELIDEPPAGEERA